MIYKFNFKRRIVMKNERKFIGLKDLILSVLLSLLVLVISTIVVIPLATLDILLSSILSVVIPATVCGIVYVLMTTKAPRIGTTFIFSLIFGIYFIISSSVTTAIIFFITGIIGELTMIGGWGKKWRAVVPYLIHWLTYTYAATIQFLLMPNRVLSTYMSMGMDEATARAAVDMYASVYTAPGNMLLCGVCTIAACLLGYFIGVKVLRKHFKAAGVA